MERITQRRRQGSALPHHPHRQLSWATAKDNIEQGQHLFIVLQTGMDRFPKHRPIRFRPIEADGLKNRTRSPLSVGYVAKIEAADAGQVRFAARRTHPLR